MTLRLGIYTDADVRGGAEAAITAFVARYPEDFEVTVMGPDEEVVRSIAAARSGARYAVLPTITDRRDLRAMAATRRAFRALDADVIHFNCSTMSSCQWAILAAATIRGQRYVVMEHSPVGTWSSMSKQLKKLTSARAAAHVTVGHRAARNIEELGGLPVGSMQVIHSGVPRMQLEAPPSRSDDFTVGMLARHDPAKGVDIAIRVVAALGAGFRLVVVGDGPQRSELESLVEELGVQDRVELRPFDPAARNLYPSFDVYLLPSRFEAFPVTVQEAMQAGVPVVATDVGSIREAIDDGETGLVVPVGDLDALEGALRWMAGHPEERLGMGERAREVGLERFDVDRAVGRWSELYRRVAADAGHRRATQDR
ncbi:MAG: glycosyltransferase family 4 protein [Microthrixaceae bacterium]|nr:glycosyltransferase family 4 protein [Microthrixaceae bacterium]